MITTSYILRFFIASLLNLLPMALMLFLAPRIADFDYFGAVGLGLFIYVSLMLLARDYIRYGVFLK